MLDKATLIVGIIRGTHGLTGNVKVESTSGEANHFYDMKEVTLRKDESERLYEIEAIEGSSSSLIIKFKGINSVDEAAKLNGAKIVVPRNMACPLNKDEFYVEDLKQCKLVYDASKDTSVTKNGLNTFGKNTVVTVGIITDVLEGGAGDLLEVEVSESLHGAINSTDKDGKARKVLVPFKKEFIGTVDIKGKTVQLMHLWIME